MFCCKSGKWISHYGVYVEITIYPKVIATNHGIIGKYNFDWWI